MSSEFGKTLKVSIFGESHGPSIGVTVQGFPAGETIDIDELNTFLQRRAPGRNSLTSSRKEADAPEFLSGLRGNVLTGDTLTAIIRNLDQKHSEYDSLIDTPRPSHADYTARLRYGDSVDTRGGGHFSGRLTLPLVAAGVIAKKQCCSSVGSGLEFKAELKEIGGETNKDKWAALLEETSHEGDSLGGIVECRIAGIPAGLGEPFFDSVESLVSHAVFSIPGVRGIEFGDGFAASRMKGSEHNDVFPLAKNGSGGINGGITNGAPIVFRVAFKPTSSIAKTQQTLNLKTGKTVDLNVPGRHDTCFAIRTPVIVEAVAAIVLADLM